MPTVNSGALPGPPALYREPAVAPQLRNSRPFRAKPLLVSGSDAIRLGEYVYQDYLFDDYGANTVPGPGNRTSPDSDIASPTDGDAFYPTDDRYANNAADLVELRIKPRPRATFFRVTLNTVKAKDATVVGIGIDADRSGDGEVEWPLGAGVSSPGLDAFITAWGTGGQVNSGEQGDPLGASQRLPDGAVKMNLARNQMTIRVPRSSYDPAGRELRLVGGTGLWDGDGWMPVPASASPTREQPASGNPLRDAPAVFNLAFRFDESNHFPALPPYDTFPAAGTWFEADQSRFLARGETGPFFTDVDFGELEQKLRWKRLHRPAGRTRVRILSSRLDSPEGVFPGEFPRYGGALQPYLITVPVGYRNGNMTVEGTAETSSKRFPNRVPNGAARAGRAGLTFALHSLGGNYAQTATFSPNQNRQFGSERGNIVVTPLARGTDGWYTDEAETDVFEAWADVAHRYKLDPERTYPTGYSMGGYGTYKLTAHYPDLFAKAFTTVGPPGRGVWIPPAPPSDGADTNTNPVLENTRWVPFMNWVEISDELVPYVGPRAQLARFDRLGLRSQLWSFAPGEHFTLAIFDQWAEARDFLGDEPRHGDPSRVNYAYIPAADRPELDLVHNHAYWVSELALRDESGEPASDPARGEIDARSLAYGEGDPETSPVGPGANLELPGVNGVSTIEGTKWDKIPQVPVENALELELENVAAARIDGARARLDGSAPLRITYTADGSGTIEITIDLPAGAVAEGPGAAITPDGLRLDVAAGEGEITVTP